MIVVKIWMWPKGDDSRRYLLGEAVIVNDGTGDRNVGNYDVQLLKRNLARYRSARVEGFPRRLRKRVATIARER